MMNVSVFYVIIAIIFQSESGKCKDILAIFPHFGRSSFFMYESYVENLASRGHKVTLMTWLNVSRPHENIKSISFGDQEVSFNLNLREYEASPKFIFALSEIQFLNEYGQKSCSLGLSNPKIKNLIDSKQRFDLVVVEYFNTDCFAVFSHVFKAPLVGIYSSAAMPWHNDRMGNPDNPSYIVNIFSGYRPEMDFFARMKNAFTLVFSKVYYAIFCTKPADKIIKAHLGKGIPKISEIVSKTSLYLVNSHFSLFQARPFVPGVVEVGGLHVQQPRKLPPELENYLKNSKNGVIYFSLGTVAIGSTLPVRKRNAILRAFANLTQNVIWKWDGDDELPDKPKNVLTKTWLPQNDLLAHPDVKLFVTHGGSMGILEAVSHGVPMIIIPLFGDQFHNGAAVAAKGAGIVLEYSSITEINFLQALNKLLQDKSYTNNARLLSARFKERPLSPMNNAIYWTEYVLKFRGAAHLQSANTKLSWFSECLLDIILFVAVTLFAAVYFARKGFIQYRELQNRKKSPRKKNK